MSEVSGKQNKWRYSLRQALTPPTFLFVCVCGKCKADGKAPRADTTLSQRCEPAVRTASAEKGGRRGGGGI